MKKGHRVSSESRLCSMMSFTISKISMSLFWKEEWSRIKQVTVILHPCQGKLSALANKIVVFNKVGTNYSPNNTSLQRSTSQNKHFGVPETKEYLTTQNYQLINLSTIEKRVAVLCPLWRTVLWLLIFKFKVYLLWEPKSVFNMDKLKWMPYPHCKWEEYKMRFQSFCLIITLKLMTQ